MSNFDYKKNNTEDHHAMTNIRSLILMIVFIFLFSILIYRIFYLQIVNGETYKTNFTLKISKESSIPSSRGKIFDCNGDLLAYNDLAYSVTIQDIFDSGSQKNMQMNQTIVELIRIIEENGDAIIRNFHIVIDEDFNYSYTLSDSKLLRFLADIYGERYTSDLTYAQKTATPDEVIEYLCQTGRFGIGEYEEQEGKKVFIPGKGYSKDEILKIITIRFAMSTNNYQKYIPTIVANEVSEKTVAQIMENSSLLTGVKISEDTVRRYVDSVYFSHIIGYTGKISQDEYDLLSADNKNYSLTDVIGKAGIENVMEDKLQGIKGSETIFVNNMGMIIDSTNRIEPIAGNDVYLTIDKDLQIAIYNLIEQNLAGILVSKIQNIKTYVARENSSASDIKIPIYDVYYALINNNIIDINQFHSENADITEQKVYSSFLEKQEQVFETLQAELLTEGTPYKDLDEEYQIYQSYIVSMLMSSNKNVLPEINIDTKDATYIAWRTDETISLQEFLTYCISKNWIDVNKLEIDSKYADSEEIYQVLVEYIFNNLTNNTVFAKKMYKYMILDDKLTGLQICQLLSEQNVIDPTLDELEQLEQGSLKPYQYMIQLISNLDITPAQLALDPCSASFVMTDSETGDVKALVTYPSYDNNKLANTVDATYYAQISNDLSNPLWDYATQQRTAPGSTFKMVSAVAALEESAITNTEKIVCLGSFERVTTPYRCWIHPGRHGALDVVGALENSCNYFFYEVGYRISTKNGTFDNKEGLDVLAYYADLFGLSETSGIEITESEPHVSDDYVIPSYIGQGNHNYTTVGLARYVTTVANEGTCYNLTLLEKVTDSSGILVEDYHAEVRNTVDLPEQTWEDLHLGMKKVVDKKAYYQNIGVTVAGKTGTAQENTSRASHALFVGFAPYEAPEIAFACRIAFGYTSDYAAQISKDVISYYYGLEEAEELLDGSAQEVINNVQSLD